MSRVVHFEVPVDDQERAATFYQTVFGWDFRKWDGPSDYWQITTGPAESRGIDGGMMMRQHPEQAITNTIGVASVDETAAAVVAAGGTIVIPKMEIPGIGYLAYFQDTEGNTFGFIERLPAQTTPESGS